MWSRITDISGDLSGQVVADIGCGPGRFIETIRDLKGTAIGLDLSDAVEAAGEIFAHDENVLICQADVLQSPLRTDSIDACVSIGVLHHTNNAKQGFDEMVRVTKPSGKVAVSVYAPGGYYDNFIVNLWRKLFKFLWPMFGHYPPLIYSYGVVYITRPLFYSRRIHGLFAPLLGYTPYVNLRDIRWAVLNTFDSITPSNQYSYTPYEVFHWMKSARLRDITPSNWAGASWHALK